MPPKTKDQNERTRIWYSGNGGCECNNAEDILPAAHIMLSYYHIRFRVNDSRVRLENISDGKKAH